VTEKDENSLSEQGQEKQGQGILATLTRVFLDVLQRIGALVLAAWEFTRDAVKQLIARLTYRRYASISYRYLARDLYDQFAEHEGTPRIVFSCADSLQACSETLILIAHYLQEEVGGNVLLIDQTFKAGGVSDRFGYNGAAGLADCLFESGHLAEEYVQSTADPGVFIMPAGSATGQGTGPLKADSVRALLEKFDHFDYVFMQQGSITMDTRYLEFARAADLVLLVVEEGKTAVAEFEECQNLFRDYQVKEMGVVMLEPSS